MTTTNLLYVRALDCAVSKHNVRTQSDEAADAELEANIGETGIILQNLIGVPVPRKKGCYEIVGGGRRLECVHRAIASGKLNEDFMVPVLVVKNTCSAIEMSFAENYYNLPMNPADECRAFQGMIEGEKKAPADLAKRFGKTERFVLGRLRLANLAQPIFEALRAGEITLDVAKAYAATADTDRQAKVFGELEGHYYQSNLNEIRRQLATGSFKGADPKAILVGRDAYLAAGGRVETDLFSDQASETWCDGDLVERLAAEAMAKAAVALREREGFAEVRAITATSVPYSQTCSLTRIEPVSMPLDPEAQGRHDAITSRLEAIEAEAQGAEYYTDEQSDEIEALNEEIETLLGASVDLTEEQKAGAVAYLIIGSDGCPQLHHEYFAMHCGDDDAGDGDSDGGGAGDGTADDDDLGTAEDGPAIPDTNDTADETYSQRLLDELASMKTELLAVHVANDPRFALDLAIFIMADRASLAGWTWIPSELSAAAAGPRTHGFESETKAAADWAELTVGLDRSWQAHETLPERYDAFCGLKENARMAWLGWAVARTLHAVPHGQKGASFLDHLGAKLAIDVASWWRPTARNFFDRLTRPRILDLFEAIGGTELRSRHMGARKFDLAVSAERLFAGDAVTEVDMKERLLSWVPRPMAFTDDVPPRNAADRGPEGGDPAGCAEDPDMSAAA
ncbi:ParB/RepB/Spo0J family partition protein [Novosphingobium sp. ZW T3_23]|uniref:ParB/RepB/Spo0J family partition protein n=1 Tax=Novosphingobium sp. ZW T3_23 TaxID=3378084 RepID=UPI0038539A14